MLVLSLQFRLLLCVVPLGGFFGILGLLLREPSLGYLTDTDRQGSPTDRAVPKFPTMCGVLEAAMGR